MCQVTSDEFITFIKNKKVEVRDDFIDGLRITKFLDRFNDVIAMKIVDKSSVFHHILKSEKI